MEAKPAPVSPMPTLAWLVISLAAGAQGQKRPSASSRLGAP
jgi:hypothetical protein